MDQIKIGKFILNIRKEKGLSQSKFAEKLCVTSQAVSKWENGRGIPDIEILKKISEEFNVDISEILNGTKKKKTLKFKIIVLGIVILLLLSTLIYLLIRNNNDFELATINSSKSMFNITGVLVSNKEKVIIYISDISYNEKNDEDEYVAIESILYEKHNDTDKQISKYGDIENIKITDSKKTYKLIDLLNNVSYNTEYYSDTCKDFSKHDFYITINALTVSGKVVAFKIPLKLINNCQE